uniref:Uncharacterized protein n=1 Tax=Candidatus Methanophaga sp. ANME-1 ERB7 TaxID=2759913 RepID=A0A7G9Z275_9EURY|nr:hypothetical protein DIMBOPOO_00032 [Methanosarcinales archaeon ANME-1 ERB7]
MCAIINFLGLVFAFIGSIIVVIAGGIFAFQVKNGGVFINPERLRHSPLLAFIGMIFIAFGFLLQILALW